MRNIYKSLFFRFDSLSFTDKAVRRTHPALRNPFPVNISTSC